MQEKMKLLMPQVKILEQVWKRLMAYIITCPKEVGGLGSVEERDGELIVTDVFLIEQTASPGDFEIDPTALSQFVNEWIAYGRDVSELKFWWHSHADMNTFWSVVDEDTMRRLAGDSYLISLVGNRRQEHRTCLTILKPVHLVIDDIKIEVIETFDQYLLDAAEEEIKLKVKQKRRSWLDKSLGKADRESFQEVESVPVDSGFLTRWRGM